MIVGFGRDPRNAAWDQMTGAASNGRRPLILNGQVRNLMATPGRIEIRINAQIPEVSSIHP